jgi:2-polyprenyl-3-methyl-5-hydroxy-6-metoxy-1,4-benzoquinol methylase
LQRQKQNEPIKFDEVSAGFGGMTGFILEALVTSGIPFQYTSTDVSASFFKATRQRYQGSGLSVDFEVLDIEIPAGSLPHLHGQFHTILSTNCLHATPPRQRTRDDSFDQMMWTGCFSR